MGKQMPKFFINPPTNGEGKNKTPIIIEGEDAYHLARVLRAKPGAQITASDGQGRCYEVILTEVTPESVRGEVLKVLPDQAEPALKITLCQSILKGEKMDWVLQKGTELGITAFIPFLSTRTIARPAPPQFAKKRERWAKIVTAAAKQSGRGVIPVVHPITSWGGLAGVLTAGYTLVAWEGEENHSLRQVLTTRFPTAPAEIRLVIGPEGGFAPEEITMLTAWGAAPVSLGPRILRAETAVPLTAALILYHYGGFEP
jgi:16S rRNA (uracil1498-N3)-methyltransferase